MLTLSGRPMPGVVADHLILALPLREPDQVQPARAGVMADVRGEPLSHRQHQRRRDEPVPAVLAEEPVDALPVLQPRLPERQHHPVDAADLQPHVTGQDLSGSTR
jgi:hypothetical protein